MTRTRPGSRRGPRSPSWRPPAPARPRGWRRRHAATGCWCAAWSRARWSTRAVRSVRSTAWWTRPRDLDELLAAALDPDLAFVVSNTTEAGYADGFPARLSAVLETRTRAGLPGLVVLPCELIERNGDRLREHVLADLAGRGVEPGGGRPHPGRDDLGRDAGRPHHHRSRAGGAGHARRPAGGRGGAVRVVGRGGAARRPDHRAPRGGADRGRGPLRAAQDPDPQRRPHGARDAHARRPVHVRPGGDRGPGDGRLAGGADARRARAGTGRSDRPRAPPSPTPSWSGSGTRSWTIDWPISRSTTTRRCATDWCPRQPTSRPDSVAVPACWASCSTRKGCVDARHRARPNRGASTPSSCPRRPTRAPARRASRSGASASAARTCTRSTAASRSSATRASWATSWPLTCWPWAWT